MLSREPWCLQMHAMYIPDSKHPNKPPNTIINFVSCIIYCRFMCVSACLCQDNIIVQVDSPSKCMAVAKAEKFCWTKILPQSYNCPCITEVFNTGQKNCGIRKFCPCMSARSKMAKIFFQVKSSGYTVQFIIMVYNCLE